MLSNLLSLTSAGIYTIYLHLVLSEKYLADHGAKKVKYYDSQLNFYIMQPNELDSVLIHTVVHQCSRVASMKDVKQLIEFTLLSARTFL